MRRFILFELNEVPFRVFDAYASSRPRSHIARLLQRSAQFAAHCEDEVQLDPWISWPTLHRGVIDRQHGMYHLGQPHEQADREYPSLWSILAESRRRVGVFGSIHTAPMPEDVASKYAFYVPDYFATDAQVHPQRLAAYQTFNVSMTRQSARNVSRNLPFSELPKVATTLMREGLTPRTVARCGKQIVAELRDGSQRVRRRNYQAELMADVFAKLMHRHRPDFATFYTNNVAAAMHRYWGALFPEEAPTLPAPWKSRYRDEVFVAMDSVDILLGRLAQFVDRHEEYVLVVASSMGQAAIPADPSDQFLTIADLETFLGQLGLQPGEWEHRPAMVPCLGVVVHDHARERLRRGLDTFSIGSFPMLRDPRPLMPMTYNETPDGFFSIFVQIDNFAGEGPAKFGDRVTTLAAAGLGSVAHEDGVNCTAQHVAQGSLLVYGPSVAASSARPEVSTIDVAPTLLHQFGVTAPAYMRGSVLPI